MSPDTRRTLLILVVAVAVFAAGALTGCLVGRSGRDGAVTVSVASPSPSEPSSPTPPVSTLPPAVETPAPAGAPAIGTDGRELAEAGREVVAAPANVACTSLVTAGVLGECGEVPVSRNRVVWVIESRPTATPTRAFTVRIFTYVTDESGWVEWLRAEDPTAERWQEVRVVARDLTLDGVPELVIGFRGQGDARILSVDVVSYSDLGIPQVVAHPDDAARGSLVFSGQGFDLYAGRYPGDEPECCPPVFSRQTVGFVDGFFRVTRAEDVVPSLVPASQL